MADQGKTNPFKPGAGSRPPLLAGRDAETRMLAKAIKLLRGPREEHGKGLASDPFPPIKIVGPRGVGKTTLLTWAEREAAKRTVYFVACEGLKQGQPQFSLRKLLEEMAGGEQKLLNRLGDLSLKVLDKVGVSVGLREAEDAYTEVVEKIVEAGPMLLLLDEVQHYDQELLAAVLQGSQRLMRRGYPLGLVLAGTPRMDSLLHKAEATFVSRCKRIHINTLSDEDTRAALKAPFEQENISVAPEALEAMAAQTDNYPYFIQLVGEAVWDAMEEAGREDVDEALVKQIGEQARQGRGYIYDDAHVRIRKGQLVPQARRVMELIESGGGEVNEDAVVKALAESGADAGRAEEMLELLKEDGFIWTVNGRTSPGVPSFFSYFKARCEE